MVDRKATICLLALAATFIAVVSVAPQTRALAITRVNVIDVVDGRIAPNSTVTIRGKTIASVAQNSAPPGDPQIVDGQGKFVIPGLWDMHAHMEMTGDSWLRLYVANGVTGIRDMGSALDFILNLREAASRVAHSALRSSRQDRFSTTRPATGPLGCGSGTRMRAEPRCNSSSVAVWI